MIRDLITGIPSIPSPTRRGPARSGCPSWCPVDPEGSTEHHLLDLEHRLDLGAVVGSPGSRGGRSGASAPRAAVDLRQDDAGARSVVGLSVVDPGQRSSAARHERPATVAMTAAEARRLAGKLIEAADLLDQDASR